MLIVKCDTSVHMDLCLWCSSIHNNGDEGAVVFVGTWEIVNMYHFTGFSQP